MIAARTIPQAATKPPAIGQRWAEANGIYVGPVAYPDGRVIGLVLPDDIASLARQAWGEYGQDVQGARSAHDGRANTLAMAQAGCAMAIAVLDIDPSAWIPSRVEAIQLWSALGESVGKGLHWTSTQDDSYYAFGQSFEGGISFWLSKVNEFLVRPVRGLELQPFSSSTFGAAPAAPDAVGQMLQTLKSSREVLACALRSAAPGMFATDADIASHRHIQRIDSAIKAAQQGGSA
jgi:hypothetical protein